MTNRSSVCSRSPWTCSCLSPSARRPLSSATSCYTRSGAIELGEHLSVRDPLNASVHSNLGYYYLSGDRCDEAIASYEKALSLSPGRTGGNYEVGLCRLLTGQAREAFDAFVAEKDDEWRVKGTALAHHALGRTNEFDSALAELISGWGDRWPSEIAQVYAWIGDVDTAFDWLDRALEIDETGLRTQFLNPLYGPIQADPRWQIFLNKTEISPAHLMAIDFEVSLPKFPSER